MESIRDILQKIKSIDKSTIADLYVVALIILVGVSAFGLGRLSASETTKEPVQIIGIEGSAAAAVGNSQLEKTTSINRSGLELESGGTLVGSRNGSKYHYPWCSGAQRIKEENKIWFESVDDARNKGYTPAANCKGLE